MALELNEKQENSRTQSILIGIGVVVVGFVAYYLYWAPSKTDSDDGEKSNQVLTQSGITPPPDGKTPPESDKKQQKGTRKKRRRSRKSSTASNMPSKNTKLDATQSGNESTSSGATASSGNTASTGTKASTARSATPSQLEGIVKQVIKTPSAPPIVPTTPDKYL